MRSIVTGCLTAVVALVVAAASCKREEPAQNPQGYQQTQQPVYTQQQQQYPQGQQPTTVQTYPQQQPQQVPAQTYPQAQPTAAPATTATGMNPNPTGTPCTSDAQCLTHRCNTALQKCSFPCVSAADCAAGMQCVSPICVPIVGAAPTAR